MDLSSRMTLKSGVEIPIFGLGVYQTRPGDETERAVRAALDLGYRHVDTARAYNNERDVGRALRDSGVPREQVFVTTKLWNTDHGYDKAIRACEKSLETVGLAYLDLYLIHWPVEGLRRESWRALETLKERGLCKSIGVSNYTVRHLEELLGGSPTVPDVNQVELSPFLQQTELTAFCAAKGIALEAYGPLTQGRKLGHRVVREIAERHRKTGAQVLLRWALEKSFIVIPKSSRRERIEENAGAFDFALTPADRAALDGLDEGFRTSWDPTNAP